jgi:hypothetical protein
MTEVAPHPTRRPIIVNEPHQYVDPPYRTAKNSINTTPKLKITNLVEPMVKCTWWSLIGVSIFMLIILFFLI